MLFSISPREAFSYVILHKPYREVFSMLFSISPREAFIMLFSISPIGRYLVCYSP